MSAEPAYKAIARKKLEQHESRIPKEWRLSDQWIPAGMLSVEDSVIVTNKYDAVNVMDVPRKCGLLNAKELDITEKWDIKGLLQQIAAGKLSSREVSEAFCKVSFFFLSFIRFQYVYSGSWLSIISTLYTGCLALISYDIPFLNSYSPQKGMALSPYTFTYKYICPLNNS